MSLLEWAITSATCVGQEMTGDRGVVITFPEGALVAAIDGLGHGPEAAEAAAEAQRVLEEAPSTPIEELVRRCHDRMRRTRGAVMTLASFDARASTMSWLGVGNVDAVLVRAHSGTAEGIVARGGTVGYSLPALHARTIPVAPGDTLVFATDGVRSGFRAEILSARHPQDIADGIVKTWGRHDDDVCVVVARYVGELGTTTTVELHSDAAIAAVRNRIRDTARMLGFSNAGAEALATAVSELARNAVRHAGGGQVVIGVLRESDRTGISVTVHDRGPGIPDVERALEDGYTTGQGLGLGLPSARRFVDELAISTAPGAGTTVTVKKWVA